MSPKLSQFTTSCELNAYLQYLSIKWSWELINCYDAMKSACDMVWEYYELKGMKPVYKNIGDIITVEVPPSGNTADDAIVSDLCHKNIMYYYAWFSFNAVSTVLRMYSLWNLFKG